MYSQLAQFTLVRKGYNNCHCHNKPLDGKSEWSVDDVMPGGDDPENLRILKKSLLKVEVGLWRQTVEFLPLRPRVELRPLKEVDITRCAAGWGWLA